MTAAPAFPSYCAVRRRLRGRGRADQRRTRPPRTTTPATPGPGFIAGLTSDRQRHHAGRLGGPGGRHLPAPGALRQLHRRRRADDDPHAVHHASTARPGRSSASRPRHRGTTWSTASVTVTLPAGINTIGVVQNAADSGNVNLDSIAVTPTADDDATRPAPTALTDHRLRRRPDRHARRLVALAGQPGDAAGAGAPGHPGPRRLVPARRHPHRAADADARRHRPALARRPALPGRLLLRLRPELQAGPGRPQRADRRRRPAARVRLRGLVLALLRLHAPPTTRTRCCRTFRSTFTPIDWLVVDTDWKSPEPVERLELEPGAVPRPAGRS